jgi:hypothetical protein
MSGKSRRSRGEFLDAFTLEDRMLVRSDRKSGKPSLSAGTDENGNPVLIKMWPKTEGDDHGELREIWQHEVRQLYRLGGYPGASTSIATLSNASFDDRGFYLVIDLGQRRPLENLLAHTPAGHWLKNQRILPNRIRLWRNLAQIAAALEILHGQGLLHRNLDKWSILASGGQEPDFQLTGFEWSMRLAGTLSSKSDASKRSAARIGPASFVEDWRAFGELSAELMGVSLKRILDLKLVPSEVADHMTAEEVKLLRQLVRAERLDRLDGEVVQQRIQEILRDATAEAAGKAAKFHLVFRFPISFAQRIREASGNDIEISDLDGLLAFVKADLGDNPLLLSIRTDAGESRLTLSGKLLTYTLSAYAPPPATPSWEMAYCERAEGSEAAAVNILGTLPMQASSLEIMGAKEGAARFPRLRGKLSSWEILRAEFAGASAKPDKLRRVHQALALTQFVEALFAAADAYPVEIVESLQGIDSDQADGDDALISLIPREDSERDALSVALGMKPPAKRIEDALLDDRRGNEWVLTEARYVGDREFSDTAWRYSRKVVQAGKPPQFIFTGSVRPAGIKNPILIPGDHLGRDVQLRRRLKALRALLDHSELLRMLDDPRMRILDSHDAINDQKLFAHLDESKQQAIASIVATVPLFLVQGPPGVGKTRLVRDLVLDTFAEDASSRLLLTAQSNAAVNHLMDELSKSLGADNKAVIVRSQSRESKEDAGPFEVSRQTQSLLEKLAASPMSADAPTKLRKALHGLASQGVGPSLGQAANDRAQPNQSRLAMEGLLVRGANIVFATTNSFELERLIDERGQFDWVMVEEAGKATGGELLAPLLLSYRRLMIGDHKQLAPYGSDRLVKLLETPNSVAAALQAGADFIGRTLRDPSTEEVLDEVDSDDSDFPGLCAIALGSVLLFERLIEDEFRTQKAKPTARKIAQRLTLQHRMHPAIASVVSHSFYDDELTSHENARNRFKTEPSPVSSLDTKRLPNAPIVFVDMPWLQDTVGMKDAERRPRWHNPEEIEATTSILSLLKVRDDLGDQPSLAVLSPYTEQVKRLKSKIDDNHSRYPVLSKLRPTVDAATYCGTVDSFQGNEADVVIVSMVRNNHHGSIRSALGFLSDARRMNVLLSRARWRLFVVGSLAFIRSTLASAAGTEAFEDVQFLQRFLDALEAQRVEGNAVVIPSSRLGGL